MQSGTLHCMQSISSYLSLLLDSCEREKEGAWPVKCIS